MEEKAEHKQVGAVYLQSFMFFFLQKMEHEKDVQHQIIKIKKYTFIFSCIIQIKI